MRLAEDAVGTVKTFPANKILEVVLNFFFFNNYFIFVCLFACFFFLFFCFILFCFCFLFFCICFLFFVALLCLYFVLFLPHLKKVTFCDFCLTFDP